MIEYKEYIIRLFFENTCWNSDNLYSFLCESSKNILDFHVSKGLSFNISSSPSENFASSYCLSLSPDLNGSIGYIVSSFPLYGSKNSHTIPINKISEVYHQVQEFKDLKKCWNQTFNSRRKDYLFYGRMYFPELLLEGLYARKISPTKQFILSYFNNPEKSDGISLTAQFQHNTSKWSTEYTYSTDDAMFGFRGLWNFGEVPKRVSINEKQNDDSASLSNNGQLSIGTEVYYGIFHKIGGCKCLLLFDLQHFLHI